MLGAVVTGLNPELIVLTGGVAESLVPLEAQILQRAAEDAFRAAPARTRVTIVPGDKRTSMRGAAALAIYEIGRAGGGTPRARWRAGPGGGAGEAAEEPGPGPHDRPA